MSGAWYPKLRAGIIPTGPNQLWVADFTDVRPERAFRFLAVVLDVCSRTAIGYAIGPTLDARMPLAALDAAIDSRRPPPGCVYHAYRGLQYSSRRYRARAAEAGLLNSMSRGGNPYDDARVESFMKTLKHEEIYPRGYRTMAEVIARAPNVGVPRCNTGGHWATVRVTRASSCLRLTTDASLRSRASCHTEQRAASAPRAAWRNTAGLP